MHCGNLLWSFQRSVINLSPFSLVECQRGCLSDTDWGQDCLEHTASLTLRQNPSWTITWDTYPTFFIFLHIYLVNVKAHKLRQNWFCTNRVNCKRIILLYWVQRITQMIDAETSPLQWIFSTSNTWQMWRNFRNLKFPHMTDLLCLWQISGMLRHSPGGGVIPCHGACLANGWWHTVIGNHSLTTIQEMGGWDAWDLCHIHLFIYLSIYSFISLLICV